MARGRANLGGAIGGVILLVFIGQLCSSSKSGRPRGLAVDELTPEQRAIASASQVPIQVHESSTIKPGFKDRSWGSAPTGMKYIGRSDGLKQLYESEDPDCIQLGDQIECGIQYLYFRKRLFGIQFANSFVTRGAYRPSILPALEAEWGTGTPVGTHREWRSRDKTYGVTVATWTPTTDSMGGRWETVRIWSEPIDVERRKVEADPNSPDMQKLKREIEEYQRQQQRERDKYKM